MYVAQGLRRAAQINPLGTSTIFQNRRRTWRETEARVARLASALQRLGLKKGDRAAILALNSDRYFEYLFAVSLAGGVVVPINTRLAAAEIAYILEDSEARILFVDENFVAALEKIDRGLTDALTLIFLGDDAAPAGMQSYEELIGAGMLLEPVSADDDLAGVFYTGGTTGRAKGVMLSHRNLLTNAANVIAPFEFDIASVYLHAAPMFHLADGSSTFAVTMVGGTHVFIPRFEPNGFLSTVAQEKSTHGVLIPTMINMLIGCERLKEHDLSTLKLIAYGGSPMPDAVADKAARLLPHCRLVHVFGMIELAPVGTVFDSRHWTSAGQHAARRRSSGHAALMVEVRIADADDHELPRGSVGELQARGPNVMLGYWNQPEATAQALRGGWMHTGDVAYMDPDGFVYIVDRLKDMIITGGENVYSAEVENVIATLDGVSEVAVIGIPDDQWGESIHAIVVAKPGRALAPDEIISHCRQMIAHYKCPRSVEVRRDPMPLSGAGKIFKSALREPFWRDRATRVS